MEEGHVPLVDPAADEGKQRRHERERDEDGQHDDNRGSGPEHREERQAHCPKAKEGDGDDRPGEDHRAARGRDRERNRVLDALAAVQAFAVAGHDEEAVVDPDTDPYHRHELGGEVGEVEDARQERDHPGARRDTGDRRRQGQAHRHH
jgi:hypothetical protein